MSPKKAPVITIDGASGTGKGTISQLLAGILKWRFLDSGALYRVLALAATKHGFNLNEDRDKESQAALEVLAEHLDVQFIAHEIELPSIILEGEDVSDLIRTEKMGDAASIIAAYPGVRAALLARQRAFRESPGLVADGRDMGTVVFPDAELKIFLMASPEERAARRYNQLKEMGKDANLATLIEELRKRDKRDQERIVAPLKPAPDAVCINTENLSIEEVIDRILDEIRGKKAFPAISPIKIEYRAVVAE